MYEKLMVEHDVTVKVTDRGTEVVVTNLANGVKREFFQAGHNATAEVLVQRFTEFMNSVTDEQATQYFPENKSKTPVEKEAVSPDLSNVKNLRYENHVCLMGKNGKFKEVTRDVFEAELVKRYGKRSTDKWIEENPRVEMPVLDIEAAKAVFTEPERVRKTEPLDEIDRGMLDAISKMRASEETLLKDAKQTLVDDTTKFLNPRFKFWLAVELLATLLLLAVYFYK